MLTIILTLKGREKFTERWLSYFKGKQFSCFVFIADSSETNDNEEIVKKYLATNPKLRYQRFEHKINKNDYLLKLKASIDTAESPYLLFADNDDFYIKDNLIQILEFLSKNPDYVGARGQKVDLRLYDKLYSQESMVTGSNYLAIESFSKSIEHEKSIDRASYFLHEWFSSQYASNWYCVFRRNVLADVINQVLQCDDLHYLIAEIMLQVLVLAKGKVKIINHPFYIRQSFTSSGGDRLYMGTKFIKQEIEQGFFREFKRILDVSGYYSEAERLLLIEWIAEFLTELIVTSSSSQTNNSALNAQKILPDFIFRHIIKIYMNIFERNGISSRRIIRVPDIEPYILSEK